MFSRNYSSEKKKKNTHFDHYQLLTNIIPRLINMNQHESLLRSFGFKTFGFQPASRLAVEQFLRQRSEANVLTGDGSFLMFPANPLLHVYTVYTYKIIYIYMYVCTYVRTYVRMYVCIYMYPRLGRVLSSFVRFQQIQPNTARFYNFGALTCF